jgi:hypothetical protein
MDAKSVSNFTPTAHNSCILEQEGEHYLFLGLKKGEVKNIFIYVHYTTMPIKTI